MKTIRYELHDGIATITFDEPGSPVNTMCRQWQQDMTTLAAQVLRDRDGLKGIILASAKSTFFAGADLKALMRLRPSDASAIFTEIEQVKKNLRTLETLGLPVVSCLNGAALGGGWEVALVGHHRIAIDDSNIQFGLPEVTLGLLPGASGVTKMTRHLGLVGAQPYLIEGQMFSPQEAQALGLVHELLDPSEHAATDMRALALAWIAAHPSAQHPWEAPGYKVPGGTPANPAVANLLAVAPAMLKQKTRGLYPAPEAILACMVEGLQVDVPTALRIESRYLAQLMTGNNARAMINTFFFDLNAIKSGRSRPGSTPQPAKVGVLGAGTMGAGIAFAQASEDTVARAHDQAQALGKIPIMVNESPSFFGSRVLGTYVMEGAAMLMEGVPAAVIENAGLRCGMPVGPLAQLDDITLSASLQMLAQTRADFEAEGRTHVASPGERVIELMVKTHQRPGRAGGAGFYEYPSEKSVKKFLWPQLKPLFEKPDAPWNIQDLKDRLLYRQAVETARCLSENVLTSVPEANIGSIFGIGFPAWTGGAMQFIYGMGIDAFVQRAHELATQFGPGFALSDEVKASIRRHQPAY